MEKIEKIDWDKRLSVDIQEIDDLQQKMFALLNVLIDMREKRADAKDASNMVAEINEYSRYYFSKEEEYLKASRYPEFNSHAREHRQFIKTTISLRRQVAEDADNLTYAVIKQLRDWLVEHIISCDQMYVPFMRINNYIDEQQRGN